MAGTEIGGKKSYATNTKDEPGFYSRIGAMGGASSRSGGFAAGEAGRERARLWGQVGGSLSRRGKNKLTETQRHKIHIQRIRDIEQTAPEPLKKKLQARKLQLTAQMRVQKEASQMQVSSLSAKYGKAKGW